MCSLMAAWFCLKLGNSFISPKTNEEDSLEKVQMAEKTPPEKAKPSSKEYYEKTYKESTAALVGVIPSIALTVTTAVLIWLFGNLIFIPVAQGIEFYGYPVPQILTFIILIALVVLVIRILADVRRAVDATAGIVACKIGAPYDVTMEEIEHYTTALRGIFYVIVVSLAFLLFVDYLAIIHPGLSAIALIVIVAWAIYQIYSAVQAISAEIKRYTSDWAKKMG